MYIDTNIICGKDTLFFLELPKKNDVFVIK